MDRRLLIIVIGGFALLTGGALFFLSSSKPAAPVEAKPEPIKTRPSLPVGSTPLPEPPPVEIKKAEPAARAAAPKRVEKAPEPAAPVAADDKGELHLDADVPGAQVFIDRVFYGPTPVVVPNLSVGAHQLNMSATGFEGISQSIDVEPGPRNLKVEFKTVRLNASIDVIHKHRTGSCRGKLVATPQGMRYETTDKDDAFSVGLLDLDDFQIDYLKKNLKIAVKKGKKYDFTDPDGNADRLFVFQRDVEKARTRLKSGDAPAKPAATPQ